LFGVDAGLYILPGVVGSKLLGCKRGNLRLPSLPIPSIKSQTGGNVLGGT